LYLVAAWVLFEIEGWLAASLHSFGTLGWRMLVEAAMAIAVIVPGFLMARIESRPFASFGLPPARAFQLNFWIGLLWGIASLSVLILALRLCGALSFTSLAVHGPRIWKFAAYYAVFFLITAAFEEFLTRGYSQWVLTRAVNFWPAAILLSVIFGALHLGNPGEAVTGLAAVVVIGLFFCLTLRRTGDLWWALGFHAAWDWGETYLYSVPDSGSILPGHLLNTIQHGPAWLTGGSVGPEGSYLIFPLLAAVALLFHRTYPHAKYTAA